jgi:acyl homoserine lactone synthase
MDFKQIHLDENGFLVRSLVTAQDREQAFRLRHKIFCERLGWLPQRPDGLELDRYDSRAASIGLFSDGALLGYLRLLPPEPSFMLEVEFRALVPAGYRFRHEPDTVEATRFAVDALRGQRVSVRCLKMMLKGLYQWVAINGVAYTYLVVEERVWRRLDVLGFGGRPIGHPAALPPAQARSLAAIIDWAEFDRYNRARNPRFFDWITTVEAAPAGAPAPPRGRGLKPAA